MKVLQQKRESEKGRRNINFGDLYVRLLQNHCHKNFDIGRHEGLQNQTKRL